MKGKASYQSIYATLPDDDEFITLSPLAKALWYTLKVKLPATGIGLINHRVVATLVNCSLDELTVAEGELTPKWIRRERNLWWIIAGLRFQPSLSAEDRKHRLYVQKQTEALPDCATTTAFKEAYSEWFDSASKDQARPFEGPSEDHGSKVEGSSLEGSYKSPSSPVETPDVAQLREMFPKLADALPPVEGRDVLLDFMLWAPDKLAYLAECSAALENMHGFELSPAELRTAISDWLSKGEKPDLRHFRGYLRNAKAPPVPRGSRSPPRKGGGVAARTWQNGLAVLPDL